MFKLLRLRNRSCRREPFVIYRRFRLILADELFNPDCGRGGVCGSRIYSFNQLFEQLLGWRIGPSQDFWLVLPLSASGFWIELAILRPTVLDKIGRYGVKFVLECVCVCSSFLLALFLPHLSCRHSVIEIRYSWFRIHPGKKAIWDYTARLTSWAMFRVVFLLFLSQTAIGNVCSGVI